MKRSIFVSLILLIAMAYQPQSLLADTGRTIEKSFPMKMGGKLVLELNAGGAVEVTGWDKDEVGVKVEIEGDDADRVNVDFEPSASVLRMHSECEKHRHADVEIDYRISVPSKFDVDVDSKGGSVTIIGVEGKLSGTTMGGALELARVKGDVHLKTMGGHVKVEDSEADGEVSTMGGAVHIRNVKGNLKGSTMGGSVVYDNVTGRSASSKDEDVHVSTMGGDIKVGTTDKKVSAKTWGGDVDVDKAEEVHVSTMGGDININEAPGGADVSTMGGDVTIHSAGRYAKVKTMGGDIELGAVDGAISASTMGGDVVATMTGDPKQGDREVNISSMGGDITLTVPDGLSMKFDLEIKYTKRHHRECKIVSDFPVHVEESPEWEHHFWGESYKHIYGTGSVGGGDNLTKIRTTNGSITIKKLV
jgi:DUF4097 and DUF4098 domain-containing protein YvlB